MTSKGHREVKGPVKGQVQDHIGLRPLYTEASDESNTLVYTIWGYMVVVKYYGAFYAKKWIVDLLLGFITLSTLLGLKSCRCIAMYMYLLLGLVG